MSEKIARNKQSGEQTFTCGELNQLTFVYYEKPNKYDYLFETQLIKNTKSQKNNLPKEGKRNTLKVKSGSRIVKIKSLKDMVKYGLYTNSGAKINGFDIKNLEVAIQEKIDGFYIDKACIEELIEYNKNRKINDINSTLDNDNGESYDFNSIDFDTIIEYDSELENYDSIDTDNSEDKIDDIDIPFIPKENIDNIQLEECLIVINKDIITKDHGVKQIKETRPFKLSKDMHDYSKMVYENVENFSVFAFNMLDTGKRTTVENINGEEKVFLDGKDCEEQLSKINEVLIEVNKELGEDISFHIDKTYNNCAYSNFGNYIIMGGSFIVEAYQNAVELGILNEDEAKNEETFKNFVKNIYLHEVGHMFNNNHKATTQKYREIQRNKIKVNQDGIKTISYKDYKDYRQTILLEEKQATDFALKHCGYDNSSSKLQLALALSTYQLNHLKLVNKNAIGKTVDIFGDDVLITS